MPAAVTLTDVDRLLLRLLAVESWWEPTAEAVPAARAGAAARAAEQAGYIDRDAGGSITLTVAGRDRAVALRDAG